MSNDPIFSALSISGSGLTAEQTRMKVVAENIANANTTRTTEGGPYKRRQVVFSSVLQNEIDGTRGPAGVRVDKIVPSNEPPIVRFDPDHPDANDAGYVSMPNISVPNEMIDMIAASRSYEANLTAIRNFKSMVNKALSIMR